MSSIVNNFSYFVNSTGRPLSNGKVYFGMPDTDPRMSTNQISIRVQQENGDLIKIPQPVRTNALGIAVFLGNPIKINIGSSLFSIRIDDNNDTLVASSNRAQFSVTSIEGQSGKYLTNNGTAIIWGDPLPDQSGNANDFLSTNGTIASWQMLLPNQSGQNSKVLSTTGTVTEWISFLPDQSNQKLKFLSTNGTDTVWQSPYPSPNSFGAQRTGSITASPVTHSFSLTFPPSGSLFAVSEATASINNAASTVVFNYLINVDGASYTATTVSAAGNRNGVTFCGFSGKEITGTPGASANFDCTLTFDVNNNIDNINFTSRVLQG